jgi:uncharacterized Zn-binding protein involved in type VI secretion
MSSICRLGDRNSGPTGLDIVITGSSTVFANNKPVVKVGDMDTGGDRMISGSSTVFVN